MLFRSEWEKKTKYFVYDDPYPFRSEYAFDRTAFESTYALAKYGATHDMAPDQNLWFDLKLKKWWSHPDVSREAARAFMDRQLASGLVVRGWLNPAYYTLGADPGVSYMAAMGGWGVLDYALNFAPSPYDWLQLGYASYLSSWSLVNSGTAETNYGFWFPGKENDGAAGWQFMSAKAGSAWMGGSVPGGVIEPRGLSVEFSTDRVGGDYRNFEMPPSVDGEACRKACEDDGKCRAWTYQQIGRAHV